MNITGQRTVPGVVAYAFCLSLCALPVGSGGRNAKADAPAKAAVQHVDWGRARAPVLSALLKRDLLKWSDELTLRLEHADAVTLIVSLDVFLRAGQPDRVSKVIPLLGKQPAAGTPDGDALYRMLKLRYYPQARLWLDVFPKLRVARDEVAPVVQWVVKTEGADAAEAWLREKARHERSPADYYWPRNWSALYWRHLAASGKLKAHVAGLEKSVRRAPAEAERVFDYLGARGTLPEDQRPAAAWLVKATRLSTALDNFVLGRWFASRNDYESAIRLYDRSLACDVTDYDRKRFNRVSQCSMYVPAKEVGTVLRRWTKGALAHACFRAKKLDRAQQLVEELTGRKDGTLKDLGPFLLAGQIQTATGKRVIAGRIAKAERTEKGSTRYWLHRARYYQGRKEPKQVERAYQAAMKLPPDNHRSELVDAYGRFLERHKRWRDAERLCRAEIDRVGVGNAGFRLRRLMRLDGKGGVRVGWDEALVWRWLAHRKKTYFGQEAQWRLRDVEHLATKADEWPAFEKKARALAAEPCPAMLRFCLGRILYRRSQAAEGIGMMAKAYDRWPKHAYPRGHDAGDEVLRALLSRGDKKAAEKVLRRLLQNPQCGLRTAWLGGIAVVAAKGGAKDIALRLWKRKAALDLTDQRGLGALASSGLARQLREHYAALAKRAPRNQAIVRALKSLSGK